MLLTGRGQLPDTRHKVSRPTRQAGRQAVHRLQPIHVGAAAHVTARPWLSVVVSASRRFPVQPDGTCTCELHAPLEPACCGYDVSVKLLALDPTDTSR